MGVHDVDVGLLQRVPMLRTLPLPSVEQLARGLEPVEVPAGQPVFSQGDVGDRYYVVESGRGGRGRGRPASSPRSAPGEGFGEIALLRRTPRTATVVARTDVRLRALRSDRFLPSSLGYTPSAREAAIGVDRLLDRYAPTTSRPPTAHPLRPARLLRIVSACPQPARCCSSPTSAATPHT